MPKIYVVEGHNNRRVNRGTIEIRWKSGGSSRADVRNGVAEFSGSGGPFNSIIWYGKTVHGAGSIDHNNPVSVNID